MTNNHEQPASTIKNRSMRWAIPYLIALGDVTIIAGKGAQGEALLYNGERPIDCFAKPRCGAAGARYPCPVDHHASRGPHGPGTFRSAAGS